MRMFKEIYLWNRHRDNIEYCLGDEHDMLEEEVYEYYMSNSDANELKELADIIFVATGAMVKKVGYKKAEAIMEIVINHNNMKNSKKDKNGKVTKEGVKGKAEDKINIILEQTRPQHIYKGVE